MDAPRQEFRHDGDVDANVLTQVRAIFQDALRHIQDSREYLTATFSCAFPVTGEARYGSVAFVVGYGDARAFTRGGDSWTSTGLAATDLLDVHPNVGYGPSDHGLERGGHKDYGERLDSPDRKRRKDDVELSDDGNSSGEGDDDELRPRKRVKVSQEASESRNGSPGSDRRRHRNATADSVHHRRPSINCWEDAVRDATLEEEVEDRERQTSETRQQAEEYDHEEEAHRQQASKAQRQSIIGQRQATADQRQGDRWRWLETEDQQRLAEAKAAIDALTNPRGVFPHNYAFPPSSPSRTRGTGSGSIAPQVQVGRGPYPTEEVSPLNTSVAVQHLSGHRNFEQFGPPSRRARHREPAPSPSPYRRPLGALRDRNPPLLHPRPRQPPHEWKLLSPPGWNPPNDQPPQPRLRTPPPPPVPSHPKLLPHHPPPRPALPPPLPRALRSPTPPGHVRDRHGGIIPIQPRSSWNELPVFNRADGTALDINHRPIRTVERPSASPENQGGDVEVESYHSSPEGTDLTEGRDRCCEREDRSREDKSRERFDESSSFSENSSRMSSADESSDSSSEHSGCSREDDDSGRPPQASNHKPVEEARAEISHPPAHHPSASNEARRDPARWDDAMNTAATLYEAELLCNVAIDERGANESYVPGDEALSWQDQAASDTCGLQAEDEVNEQDDSKAEDEKEELETANISGSGSEAEVEEDSAVHDEIEEQLGTTEGTGHGLPLTVDASITSTTVTTALAADVVVADTSISYAGETYCNDPEAAAALLALGDVTSNSVSQSSTNPTLPGNTTTDSTGEWDDALTLQLLAELEAAMMPPPPPLRPGPVNRLLNPPSSSTFPARGRGIGPSPLQASYVPSPTPPTPSASPPAGQPSLSPGTPLSPRVLRAPTPGGPSTPSPASCPPSFRRSPVEPPTPSRVLDTPLKAPTPGGPSTPSPDASAIAAGDIGFGILEGNLSPDGSSTPIELARQRLRTGRAPATPTPISRLSTDAFAKRQKGEGEEVRAAPIGRLSSPPPREGESSRAAVREAREHSFHPYSRPASIGSAELSEERRKQGEGIGNAGETSSEMDANVVRAAWRDSTGASVAESPLSDSAPPSALSRSDAARCDLTRSRSPSRNGREPLSNPAAASPLSELAPSEPKSEVSPGLVEARRMIRDASTAVPAASPPPPLPPSRPAKRAKRETVKKDMREPTPKPELEPAEETARRYPRRNTRRPPPR